MMSQKIKLPKKFELCSDGGVRDDILDMLGMGWKGVEIFKNLIEEAENSSYKPQFIKFDEPVNHLSADFLSSQAYSGDSIRYGRTTVYQDIAIKMQKKGPGFYLLTQKESCDSSLLPDQFYIDTVMKPDSRNSWIKYIYVSVGGELQEKTAVFTGTLKLPVPLTHDAFVANLDKIKESVLYDAIYHKYISHFHREDERPELLSNEYIMQCILSKDNALESDIPAPIGVGYDSTTKRHFCAFHVPKGYYTYLSDITDTTAFITSASRAAHDLGYLLRQGYVFQNLISVFHDKYRPYTLLPEVTKVAAGNYGGFSGKIMSIIGQNLYENIGQSGLRDLGDLEFIDDFRFYDNRSDEKNASVSLKIAHFISLYLMVFTILIGNRSRKLECMGLEKDNWSKNHLIYSQILKALFRGLNISLSDIELFYIDPSVLKAKKSDGAERLMQPGEKFNQQLRVWFTTSPCINDEVATAETEIVLQRAVYGSTKASYARIQFEEKLKWNQVNENQYMEGFSCERTGAPRMAYYTREVLWGYNPGCLGQPSGINPLTTAVKYALRAAQFSVEKMYQLPNITELTQATPKSSMVLATAKKNESNSSIVDQTIPSVFPIYGEAEKKVTETDVKQGQASNHSSLIPKLPYCVDLQQGTEFLDFLKKMVCLDLSHSPQIYFYFNFYNTMITQKRDASNLPVLNEDLINYICHVIYLLPKTVSIPKFCIVSERETDFSLEDGSELSGIRSNLSWFIWCVNQKLAYYKDLRNISRELPSINEWEISCVGNRENENKNTFFQHKIHEKTCNPGKVIVMIDNDFSGQQFSQCPKKSPGLSIFNIQIHAPKKQKTQNLVVF